MRVHSNHCPKRRIPCLASALLGSCLLQGAIQAQPNIKPGTAKEETYSLQELERFINGRTLVTVDIKDATLKDVAAALAQSTGLKVSEAAVWVPPPFGLLGGRLPSVLGPGNRVVNAGAPPVPSPKIAPATAPVPPVTYSVKAQNQPYWEAMRQWHLDAFRENEKARKAARAQAFAEKKPFLASSFVPKSFNARPYTGGMEISQGNSLSGGYAVANWPVLLVGQTIKRTQRAGLTEAGAPVAEIPPPVRVFPPKLGGAEVPQTPDDQEALTAAQKRWTDGLSMAVNVFFDPKISPSRVRYEILEAVDDKGNDLRFPTTSSNITSMNQTSWPLSFDLASKPKMGKKLVKLRGVLRFNVPTRVQHWETTDLSTPVEDTLKLEGGDFKISFTGLTKNGEGWAGSFKATSRGKHLERFWNDRFATRNTGRPVGVLDFDGLPSIHLVDAKGNVMGGAPSTEGWGLQNLKPRETGTQDPGTQDPGSRPAPVSPDLSPSPP